MKKFKRGSRMELDYKKLEVKGSGAIGEKVLNRYESSPGIRHVFKRHNKKILENISLTPYENLASTRLLEIGCGFGEFLAEAQKIIGQVYGIDLVQDQLRAAKTRISGNSSVLMADGEYLPFGDHVFDFILMKGVVHHLGNPRQVFKEARRVLLDNGKLIIFEGNPSSWYRKFVLGIADLLRIEHESSLFPHLSSDKIEAFLRKTGFSTEHKRVSGLFAPLGLAGIGNNILWEKLNYLEDVLENTFSFFMWYNLIIATPA